MVVQFSAFDCPESAKISSHLEKLQENDRFSLQVIFKHLPRNPAALQIHEASLAAGAQGKFWQMHERLFKRPEANYTELLEIAKSLDLDVPRLQTDLDERHFRQSVLRDLAEAKGFGITKSPTLFVNGRKLEGIDQVRAFVNALINPTPFGLDPEKTYQFDLTGSPSRGPADAPITIVEFSDFRCGFCGPNSRNLSKIELAYPGKVRRVFKHFPLKSDALARLPQLGAVAAEKQDKFWEMRESLMNRPLVDQDDLLARARSIGLDLNRFQEDLLTGSQAIDRDLGAANAIGIRRAPTTFINGKPFGGRQSFRALQKELNHILDITTPEALTPLVKTPAQGPDNANITLEFYCDYSQPQSHKLSKILNTFLAETREDVRVEFRPYTVSEKPSDLALNEIAFAAAAQRKFKQWQKVALPPSGPVGQAQLRELLEEIDVDLDSVSDDLADRIHRPLIESNAEEARNLGLKGESALVMNGIPFEGVPTLKDLHSRAADNCCGGRDTGESNFSISSIPLGEKLDSKSSKK